MKRQGIHATSVDHDSLRILHTHMLRSKSSEQDVSRTILLDLNAELAEVLRVPHVLVSLLGLVESEDLLVDDGLDVVGLDRTVHLFELESVADEDAANGADIVLIRRQLSVMEQIW